MPDIIIRGAEIPKSCAVCKIRSYNAYCPLNETIKFMYDPTNRGFDFCTGTHPKCPLEQLSEHGDLIDRAAFRAEMDNHYPFGRGTQRRHGEADAAKSTIINMLANAPVIVPSNKEAAD